MPPPLLTLTPIQELLVWYEQNLCNVRLIDSRRGFRVRFSPTSFIHLIQLTDKYGKEPKNKRIALEEIKRGRINFVRGRFDEQRASELSWAREIATTPCKIVKNWQALGDGDEAYIKNFGGEEVPKYRVLICKAIGKLREAWTIFPRERITERDLANQIWPQKSEGAGASPARSTQLTQAPGSGHS